MEQKELKDYRCPCGKLLFKGSFSEGIVEVKCKHCHKVVSFLGGEFYEGSNSSSLSQERTG